MAAILQASPPAASTKPTDLNKKKDFMLGKNQASTPYSKKQTVTATWYSKLWLIIKESQDNFGRFQAAVCKNSVMWKVDNNKTAKNNSGRLKTKTETNDDPKTTPMAKAVAATVAQVSLTSSNNIETIELIASPKA
eukprot:Lithocolla_globosa_v1_NODE_750_length_3334_cov_26.166819.p3 type:complete len:136 gc:universal NODE_750_length_3334_cov_26.166819:485-892(+)